MYRIFVVSIYILLFTAPVSADFRWHSWRRLPVFDSGRVMPLNTLARNAVSEICGTPTPFLQNDEMLLGALKRGGFLEFFRNETLEEHERIAKRIEELIPPNGRQFQSHELLLSWMLEPEIWRFIPFIKVRDELYRIEVLNLSYSNNQQYVAPIQLDTSKGFQERITELRKARQTGNSEKSGAYDKLTLDLFAERSHFNEMAFDPRFDEPYSFYEHLRMASESYANMTMLSQRLENSKIQEQLGELGHKLLSLTSLENDDTQLSLDETESQLEKILSTLETIKAESEAMLREAFAGGAESTEMQMSVFYFDFSINAFDVALQDTYRSLYEQGRTIRVLPAIQASAIRSDRSGSSGSNPWLGFKMLQIASDATLKRFANKNETEIREAIAALKDAYIGSDEAAFNSALADFSIALRTAGFGNEEFRRSLIPESIQNNEMLRKTEYPVLRTMDVELRYSDLNPFFWMWLSTLAGIGFGFFSYGFRFMNQKPAEETMQWVGIGCLVFSAAISAIGLSIRAYISGWAPVTNMYETIILVAFLSTLLALWLTLEPMLKPLLGIAWRQNTTSKAVGYKYAIITSRLILTLLTLLAMIYVCFPEYAGKHGVFAAFGQFFTIVDPIDEIVVIASVAFVVFYLPKLILTCFLLPFAVFSKELKPVVGAVCSANGTVNRVHGSAYGYGGDLISHLESLEAETHAPRQASEFWDWLAEARDRILERKLFFLCCAAVAFAAGFFAYTNTRDFNPQIRPIMAVLRSNFWLVIHVTAIVISYAIGLVAWTLALASLGGFLFGSYSDNEKRLAEPKLCTMLAPYILTLIQTATLFLAIGTILGGRWADYSWGRFWGWDPKEVWALITLLVYLITLHGYRAKFYGNIGISLGAIAGAVAVIVTWYAFNFVFKVGRHAYGNSGNDSTTLFLMISVVLAGFLLIWGTAAVVRYRLETQKT